MKEYFKAPELNLGQLPSIEENEELNKTATEKQKKV